MQNRVLLSIVASKNPGATMAAMVAEIETLKKAVTAKDETIADQKTEIYKLEASKETLNAMAFGAELNLEEFRDEYLGDGAGPMTWKEKKRVRLERAGGSHLRY